MRSCVLLFLSFDQHRIDRTVLARSRCHACEARFSLYQAALCNDVRTNKLRIGVVLLDLHDFQSLYFAFDYDVRGLDANSQILSPAASRPHLDYLLLAQRSRNKVASALAAGLFARLVIFSARCLPASANRPLHYATPFSAIVPIMIPIIIETTAPTTQTIANWLMSRNCPKATSV